MSRKDNGGRDPKTMKHVFVKVGDSYVEFVMPPMDKEAELAKRRCDNFLLEMIIKYGPDIQAEKEKSV